MTLTIITPNPNDPQTVEQMAHILLNAFKENWPNAWPTLKEALEEVQEALSSERICRVALDEDGAVSGWIGGNRQYEGNVWELHPLAVDPAKQKQGIGRALAQDFEAQVRAKGGHTIWLGSDDENNMTSLAGVNLYPNVWEHLANIKNLRGHPYEFYQKMGFVITGVLPDANGPGKPDIFMAKRIATNLPKNSGGPVR